jgi:hypothetical protein
LEAASSSPFALPSQIRSEVEASLKVEADLGLISPTFYKLLLHMQIPKAQKDTDDLAVYLRFWDLSV